MKLENKGYIKTQKPVKAMKDGKCDVLMRGQSVGVGLATSEEQWRVFPVGIKAPHLPASPDY